MTLNAFQTPPWVLLVETDTSIIIRKLEYFLDTDPPYLAEVLRSLGVHVVSPKNEKAANNVARGILLPPRKLVTPAMKLFIVLLALVGAYIWLAFPYILEIPVES
jgi:hypothetical protein